MSILAWIIVTSLFGGMLSVLFAAALTLNTRASWVQMLVSYAIGALLGAAFLNALPEALELSKNPAQMTATVLFGILLFFILEKLVLWRHCHAAECEAHDRLPGAAIVAIPSSDQHDHGRSGMMIMLGDTFHNFVDGILIAAAFMADVQLGIVTSIAIIAHEIPQEAGDFLILLNSGYTRRQALLFNLFSSAATLLGGLSTYFMLQDMNHFIPSLLGLAAASMIYVAMSDLIPGLHKRPEIGATVQQVALITLGISSLWLAGSLFTHPA
ncbi:MAG TPA: ZIP family metal transporter [Bryobacteraceae bacterium]|nr:ZIP family metal transporter [Bryobacteraceae bacterium]